MPQSISYTVPAHMDGQTVQTFLRRDCGMSWRTVVRLKRVENGILLDGVHVRTIDLLKSGQTLTVTWPEDTVRIEGVSMPLAVVYEDEDVLVVNKPPFLAVHPSAGKPDPTLANAVVAYYRERGECHSFRPLNRLDRNTSGLLLAAKSAHMAYRLAGQCQKEYVAVVTGTLTGDGVIHQPIRVKEGCTITREVGEGGKDSLTRYRAVAHDGSVSLLRVVIETGRTHQIRVHMAWLGHPLVGDTVYGTNEELPRHALHCARMVFTHPRSGEKIDLQAPLPDDMVGLLKMHGMEWALEGEDPFCLL